SFKELENEQKEGKKNYCFSIQEDGSIGVGLIKNTWKTKSNVEVIRVVLDNNQEIICTPDHKFMLRDGSYQEARNLLKTDSLMPLNRKITKKGGLITIDGYEMTLCPKRQKWIFTHLLVDRYNLTKKKYFKKGNSVVHHLDYNKLNNSPDNLSRMDKMEHLYFHAIVARDNLSKPETLEKIRQAHQTKEYREKIKKTMSQPAIKEMLSQRAKKQWKSKEYKKYMVEKFLDFYRNNSAYREKNNKLLNNAQKEYWANTDNRMKQAERVKKYFENNPEHRTKYSQRAQKQWKNKGLLEWRSETTKKQWTKTFRQKRKIAYDKTYLSCSLGLLREVFDNFGAVSRDNYKELRLRKKAKNALKYETLLERFFEDNESKLIEAVANYNHKIKKIEAIQQRRDVYDLEVEGTHNFALSAGVFVHNSSKMARDRRFQAILPLRGKVLNVERARLDKILANNEIKNLVIALGTAIAQDFDIKRLRYHRIVIMSDADVDGSHIRTLLLTLFYRYFREIIENGYLYIAQPPLYKIQSGKRMEYAYTDEDKNEIILDFTKNKALKGKGNIA
ncbi:intein-containing DNA gyrase subunit B, partial [Candidatus Gribaldobacteria bacterium]|nr:intein-containing DNA gyrase subunit B [Candidatus Gribaldobacteria bacterium]